MSTPEPPPAPMPPPAGAAAADAPAPAADAPAPAADAPAPAADAPAAAADAPAAAADAPADAGPPVTPAPATADGATPGHHHTRLIISIALLVVTLVATPLFIVAIWVHTAITDTDRYVHDGRPAGR